jgi:site-specific recombinase XerD
MSRREFARDFALSRIRRRSFLVGSGGGTPDIYFEESGSSSLDLNTWRCGVGSITYREDQAARLPGNTSRNAEDGCRYASSRVCVGRIQVSPTWKGLPRVRLREARNQYIRWLVTTRDLSPHTIRAYDGDIAALERYLGPQARVAQIAGPELLAFVEEQRLAGLAPKSIRRRASGLRGFTRWLLQRDYMQADPWSGIALSLGRTRTLPRPVATYDLDRLLLSLRRSAGVEPEPIPGTVLGRPREATTLLAVAIMVTTGLRVSEVVSLRHRDVDLQAGTLRVLGKGRRERLVFLTNEWLASLASSYLATRSFHHIAHERLLFDSHGSPLTSAALRARLLKAGDQAGLSHRVTPHMLRHTAATQLIESGVDIRYVQTLLGHASLTTTELYTHVADHALRRVVSEADVLGRSFARDN